MNEWIGGLVDGCVRLESKIRCTLCVRVSAYKFAGEFYLKMYSSCIRILIPIIISLQHMGQSGEGHVLGLSGENQKKIFGCKRHRM